VKSNILIDEEGNARITDFGLINIAESQALATSFTSYTDRGTVRWMAPELFGEQVKINRSTDVYAFGMTIDQVHPFKVSLSPDSITTCRYIPTQRPFQGTKMTSRSSWR
jgi:serine/threonine protein kinase